MTETEIVLEVAKLDGWIIQDRSQHEKWLYALCKPESCCHAYSNDLSEFIEDVPKYTTSRDAIFPLIEKQSPDILFKMVRFAVSNFFDGWYEKNVVNVLLQSPENLCIALLKAHGKIK